MFFVHQFLLIFFIIILFLGLKLGHKRPLVKILKVEDLKNDDIVERIKRELGQQFSFKLDSSASKLLGTTELSKKTKDCSKPAVRPPILSTGCSLVSEFSENTGTSGDHTKSSVELGRNIEEIPDNPEDAKKIKVDPDSKEAMKPPEKNYVLLNKKVHLERMRRFVSMTKNDLPLRSERKFKCEGPLSDLKAPVDTIRCSKCGVLYQSDILRAHLKACQGEKRKTKYGCRLCSFTDSEYRQLQAHVKSAHPKRSKKIS